MVFMSQKYNNFGDFLARCKRIQKSQKIKIIMTKKEEVKKISELGEFGLIDHISKNFDINTGSIIKGIGDDAAVVKNSDDSTVVTTDLLIEGIHFDLIYTPLKHLGYKSVVVNLSDLYAMNSTPVGITVSIALSNKFSLKAVEEIYSGIKHACEVYGVSLIGGDTSSSVTGLFISVTAIGKANEKDIVYRSGANINDLICVSGDLGAAYLGLQMLEREKEVFLSDKDIKPKLENCEYILQRQLKPEARKDIISSFKEHKIKPTSMIDISDGLSSELLHICKESQKSCKIYEEKLPIHPQSIEISSQFNLDPSIPALNGGEDYELLFTVPLSLNEFMSRIPDVSIIGHICEKGADSVLVTKNGTEVKLEAQGWSHSKD